MSTNDHDPLPPDDGTPRLRAAAHYLEEQRLTRSPWNDGERTRRSKMRSFEDLTAALSATERPSALLMASVNVLEAINAGYGYDVGDAVIAAIGRRLGSGPSGPAAVVRYRSNIFAIIVEGGADAEMANAARRLIALVGGTPLETPAGPLSATISIGGIALPHHAPGEAIASALEALDLAKERPGTFVAHSPELAERNARSRAESQSVLSAAMSALAEDRVLLVFQPIVDARSGSPALYEALLRLRTHDGQLVAAADFMEEAEKLGLTGMLDRRALDLALPLLTAHAALRLSLNISSRTAGDAEWISVLSAACASEPGIGSRLTIEITETTAIQDPDRIAAFIDLLHGWQCKVAIDDFGAGFTSLRHLKTLDVDMLKIDGMFMADLPGDSRARVLVKSLIEIADAFDLESVAEWVGDEETARFLSAAGVTYLQGYLFGEPISREELERRHAAAEQSTASAPAPDGPSS